MSTHRLYFSSDPVNAEMTGPAGCSERSMMKNRCLVFSQSKPKRPGKYEILSEIHASLYPTNANVTLSLSYT